MSRRSSRRRQREPSLTDIASQLLKTNSDPPGFEKKFINEEIGKPLLFTLPNIRENVLANNFRNLQLHLLAWSMVEVLLIKVKN